MTVTNASKGALRPSVVAISGGEAEALRRSRDRRQKMVDTVRAMTDDELADLLDEAERIAAKHGDVSATDRRDLWETFKKIYVRAGWE